MSVQWFPGHMTKAIRLVETQLKAVDVIIECRDSRIPFASGNPLIENIAQNKKRLIVLTKKDLALSDKLAESSKTLSLAAGVIAVDAFKDNVKNKIETAIEKLMAEKFARDQKRGIKARQVRAMIMGVPNVGKSTLINRMAKKKVVVAENRPGVTMSLTKINISDKLEIIDTPGLLWPKFSDPETGIKLALCLSVKQTGFKTEDICHYGFEKLKVIYGDKMKQYYGIADLSDFYLFIKAISAKTQQDGMDVFLQDIWKHRFGRMSWE